MSLLELRILAALTAELVAETIAAGFDAIENLAERAEGLRQRLGL